MINDIKLFIRAFGAGFAVYILIPILRHIFIGVYDDQKHSQRSEE